MVAIVVVDVDDIDHWPTLDNDRCSPVAIVDHRVILITLHPLTYARPPPTHTLNLHHLLIILYHIRISIISLTNFVSYPSPSPSPPSLLVID